CLSSRRHPTAIPQLIPSARSTHPRQTRSATARRTPLHARGRRRNRSFPGDLPPTGRSSVASSVRTAALLPPSPPRASGNPHGGGSQKRATGKCRRRRRRAQNDRQALPQPLQPPLLPSSEYRNRPCFCLGTRRNLSEERLG